VLTFDPDPGYPDLSDVRIEWYYYDGNAWAEEWTIDNVEVRLLPGPPALMNEAGLDSDCAGFDSP